MVDSMVHVMRFLIRASVGLGVLAFANSSLAGVLVLNNGDRITGEIKQIWDAEVIIEPAYSDEFSVDMDVIVSIESDREFEITLDDGREVVARPDGADAEGKQVLVIAQERIPLAVDALTELDEIDEYFDWDSWVDWSAALNKGNTDSNNTRLVGRTALRLGDHRHNGEIAIAREEQNGVSVKEQDTLVYDYNWLFSEPWFLSAGYSFERDPIRELINRSIGSLGIGRDIFNTPRLTLSIQLGAGAIRENIGGITDESSVINWKLQYRQDLFGEDLEVFHNQSIVRYLSGRENTIFKTSSGLRYEITDLLYATAGLNYDYETEVVGESDNEDIGLLFGFGLEF